MIKKKKAQICVYFFCECTSATFRNSALNTIFNTYRLCPEPSPSVHERSHYLPGISLKALLASPDKN